jgi:predicted ribosomally synthesized peptide with nif11-like leader
MVTGIDVFRVYQNEEVLSVSVENLKKYGQLCAEQEKVRKKAKEIGLQDVDGQIAYAKTLGLEFSKEDAEALAKEAGLDKKDELSEEDLQKVAGGFFTSTLGAVALFSAVIAGGAVGGAVVGSVSIKGKGW